MADAELRQMLMAAHDTIATGGLNKTEPGQFKGTGARANQQRGPGAALPRQRCLDSLHGRVRAGASTTR